MTIDSENVEVAVTLPVYQTYTYRIPEKLSPQAVAGKRVLVPFGARKVTGYILGPGTVDGLPEIKPLIDILDTRPLFPQSLISFYRWISEYYIHPLGEVIQSALPAGLNIHDAPILKLTPEGKNRLQSAQLLAHGERAALNLIHEKSRGKGGFRHDTGGKIEPAIVRSLEKQGWIEQKRQLVGGKTGHRTERYARLVGKNPDEVKLSPKRQQLLDILRMEGECSVRYLKTFAKSASFLLKTLAESGRVEIFEKRLLRDPFGDPIEPDTPPELTDEQQDVVGKIQNAFGSGFKTFLLSGVTGSGKTEVYLHLADRMMALGRQVLILVPEIALISQMERRFRARFGDGIAVLHSGLSSGERYDQWIRIREEKCGIAIGTRSAIFAPFDKLGLIIVDEEHDASYKQESSLRYNARDLAVVRAKFEQGICILGSATPSIQSSFNAAQGKFIQLNMKYRVERRPLPDIHIVDLSRYRDQRGTGKFLTPPLVTAMEEALARKEQVLLFLNRRGFSSFPICNDCNSPLRCQNCAISLTYHHRENVYKCHYCGFTRPAGRPCDNCHSPEIRNLGLGTEKLEAIIGERFPEARIARMDRDTTLRKGAILKLLKGLKNRNTDILIGTQIVAKGHDFPGITLVGIVCADLSLNFPDFRAGERTFQLMAQVAGRAGRGDRPGNVILQTFNPDHFSMTAARHQDFQQFYDHEITFRKSLQYPPFSRMILIKIWSRNVANAEKCALRMARHFREAKGEAALFKSTEILGPIPSPVSKIAGNYRWQLLLKSPSSTKLHSLVSNVLFGGSGKAPRWEARFAVDMDPYFMM